MESLPKNFTKSFFIIHFVLKAMEELFWKKGFLTLLAVIVTNIDLR